MFQKRKVRTRKAERQKEEKQMLKLDKKEFYI